MAHWLLVAEPARAGHCPRCGSDRLVERDYLALDPPAYFRDCPRCQVTWEIGSRLEYPSGLGRTRDPVIQFPPLAKKERRL